MSEQKWRCPAAINIAGKHYECDTEVLGGGPHTGWPHSNTEAEAIWTEGPHPVSRPQTTRAGD